MNDGVGFLDYGEDLVWRHRRSGLTRKEFAAEAGIAVTALECCIRRVNRSISAGEASVIRILPVELVTCERGEPTARGAQSAVVVCRGNSWGGGSPLRFRRAVAPRSAGRTRSEHQWGA